MSDRRPDDLPPVIAWCSRNGEVVFFLALLVPVLMEGCAVHAASRRGPPAPPATQSP